ncbi:uncharacterized protein LAESUDRAFT_653898 [Laetiporus sulphureus 93-53]|uniref:Uncharacterized protein n=1 Tax=Laetiporus sulphureus 93-53 TaxID=1314785 RepID=A0A165E6W8_9APHY|nr:uncharacterized protein LAESUDRAFT_653898 [Laetiporus sulphureus 93-53]KZT06356.1 hypothetical protein LAESUDRAFT_653898 [Laetiporus sulphureus 93-53]
MQETPALAQKRNFNAVMLEEARYGDPSVASLPSFDKNAWYYPSHVYEDDGIRYTAAKGNWGRKTVHDARWVRRGKIAPWAPGLEDWEAEERARKRIKLLLPPEPEPPSTIVLPHLRSPSPPLTAPYPTPNTQHFSYTSFVMDKAVTNSFRSRLLDELESATNSLIEGETALRRALGRLWQVMSEDPEPTSGTVQQNVLLKNAGGAPVNGEEDASVVPKREDEGDDEDDEREERLARAPDLTPVVHKLFLLMNGEGAGTVYDGAHFSHPDVQLESLEKSLATLREFQDDGREYIERLEEIRDGLGDARTQRNGVWDLVRRKAIKELQDVASSSASAL